MARIPEDVIRTVQESADLVDVISRYVTLKRSGSSYKALCPFHDEKTPSFHVFPGSGRYKCFGCQESGDVFTFLMRRNSMSFRQAVEEVARERGIALPADDGPDEAGGRRRAALAALAFAERFYREVLRRSATAAAARAYLASRGMRAATVEEFGLGFAPPDWEGLTRYARGKGITEEALFDAGLMRRNESGRPHDMFRERIMFPIRDLRGAVVGFGARALGDAQPKYLNSPDGPLFRKGREMYGLSLAVPEARRRGRLLVVEGYTDVIACRQAGLPEAAAGLGTALTPENARTLGRFGLPVILLYDGDEAGRRAAEAAAEVLLAEKVEGSVALLPAGLDPADAVAKGGAGAVEEALSGSRDLFDYRVERVLARHPMDHLDGRRRAVEELLGTVEKMADPVRRDVALKLLAERLGVREANLRDNMELAARRRLRPRVEGQAPAEAGGAPGWREAEEDLLAALLCDATFWEQLAEAYPPEEFRDPALRVVAGAAGELAARGRAITREALLAKLEADDEAVVALTRIEIDLDTKEKAQQHLDRIAEAKRVESALAAPDPLAAVVQARRRQTHRTNSQ